MFLAIRFIILKLYNAHLFIFFLSVSCFNVFNLSNLFKSLIVSKQILSFEGKIIKISIITIRFVKSKLNFTYCTGCVIMFKFWSLFLFILSKPELSSNFWYFYFKVLVCAFNSLANGKYSIFFIVAAFSNISFPGKTSLLVKNLYLLTIPDDKAEILAVCLFKLNWTLFCSILYALL